jgi:hypothetical protein
MMGQAACPLGKILSRWGEVSFFGCFVFNQRTNKFDLAIFSAIIAYTNDTL